MSTYRFRTQSPSTAIVVRRTADGVQVASGTTDRNGVFAADLTPGPAYTALFGTEGGFLPAVPPEPDGGTTTPTKPVVKAAPTGFGQPGSARSAWAFNQALLQAVKKVGSDVWFPLLDPAAPFVLAFGNQFVSQAGGAPDVEGTNPLVISAAVVKTDGTKVPVLFGGQRTVTVGRGLPLTWSDSMSVPAGSLRTSLDTTSVAITGPGGTTKQGIVIQTYVEAPADITSATSTTPSATATNTITDPNAAASWKGLRVFGTNGGIPTIAYVTNVTPGVGYQLASNPTDAQPTLVNTTAQVNGVTLASFIPCNYNRLSEFDKASVDNVGADPTLSPGLLSSSGQNGLYGPMGLFIAGTKDPVHTIRTNSIGAGLSDAKLYRGVVASAIKADAAILKHSRGGEAAQVAVALSTRRLQDPFLAGPTHSASELFTNDSIFTNATTLQQAIDRLAQLVAIDRAAGHRRIAWCTVPPRTDASNVPLASAQPAILGQFNDYIRSKPLGIDYVIELAGICMASTNSGTWRGGVNATPTANVHGSIDGVHLSPWLMDSEFITLWDAYFAWAATS